MWQAAAISAAGSVLGGVLDARSQREAAQDNAAAQREFAQHGVRWKVEDAKAAGIHPLYAMGAQTHAFTPSYVGGDSGKYLAQAGQDISRAVAAGSTVGERQQQQQLRSLEIERMGLENEKLRAEIGRLSNPSLGQVGPAFPSAVSYPVNAGSAPPPVDLVSFQPAEVQIARGGDPSHSAGPAGPGFTQYDFGPLGQWSLPSDKASQALEDMELAKYIAVLSGNWHKISGMLGRQQNLNLPRTAYNYVTRPDWVKRIEAQTGERLIPFYGSDGKLRWKGMKLGF